MTVPLAEVVRSGFVEGHHAGTAVVLDATGTVVDAAGDPSRSVFPRSANKPMQVAGMLDAGLRLDPPELALAAASHSGEIRHVERVRTMLADGGLGPDDLGCPPDLPLDQTAARAVLAAGGGPSRLTMNCSGKHAAMLRTCRAAGWPLDGYLDPAHPLQRAVRATVERLAGTACSAVGVDGCGAPLFALPLAGVAAAFLRLVEAKPGTSAHAVAAAMRAHPEMVGGTGRDVTLLMTAVPGLLVKDGAEGLYAAAVPGRGAVAVKIEDGAARARVPVVVSALRRLGVAGPALDRLARYPVWGGGRIVGAVHALW